ncbi:MAG TPA: hypothetical protein DDY91_21265 [Planctomycetaceae bacterium]|nr:hypothetical protein [Planctomycetaceae bacterium]
MWQTLLRDPIDSRLETETVSLQGCVNASSHDRRGSLQCGPDSLFSIDKIATSRGERSASTSIPDPTLRPHGTEGVTHKRTIQHSNERGIPEQSGAAMPISTCWPKQ